MPRDAAGRAETIRWVIVALDSVGMVSVPRWFLDVTGAGKNGLTRWLESRLGHPERVLGACEWLAARRHR